VELKNSALAGDIKGAGQEAKKISILIMTNVIIPAVVEELVTPYTNKEHKSGLEYAAKVLLGGMASTMPVVREVVHHFVREDGSDDLGLLGTAAKDLMALPKDIKKGHALEAKNIGKLIEDSAAMAGVLRGFPIVAGHMAKFAINYSQDREHPKDLIQSPWSKEHRKSLLGGLISGTAEIKH
jgi:hypothetical protein